MRYLIAVLTVIATCSSVCTAQADLDVGAKLPTDTRLLVRARLAGILRTPLGQAIDTAHDLKLNEIRQFVGQHIGLELDRVEDVWVVSCKPDTGVIIFKGDLDAGRIPFVFGQNPDVREIARGGCLFVAEFKDKDSGKMQMGAVVDRHTVAFGDIPSMNHYLDVVTGKSDALPVSNSQLCAFRATSGLVAATILGNLAQWGDFDADLAAAIRNMQLGVDVDDDAALRLTLEAVDERQAEGFELTLRGLLILKGESEGLRANAFLYRLAQRASVKRQGSTVIVDSVLPGDFLKSIAASKLK